MRQRFGCEGVFLHQADVHLAELLLKSLSALEMEAKVSQSPSHHLKSLLLFFCFEQAASALVLCLICGQQETISFISR